MSTKVYMFHDVRDNDDDLARRFPGRYELKSFLNRKDFIRRIKYIKNVSDVISIRDFMKLDNTSNGDYSVITFDDGLLDHFKIQDILLDEDIPATFFIPARPVLKNVVMNSHKIQFIIASKDEKTISNEILNKIDDDKLWSKYSVSKWKNNSWTPEMVFITNVLRKHEKGIELTNNLFGKYVTKDEFDFSKQLYLSEEQIKEIINNGMDIGGHGYNSEDLPQMEKDVCLEDISHSFDFIKKFYKSTNFFSYPNGGYNEFVLNILENLGYNLAFTTENRYYETKSHKLLSIPRIDGSQFLMT